MAFNRQYGYLFQIGQSTEQTANHIMRYVDYESYKCSRKVQDLDSFRDANGVLHRNVLDNAPLTVSFNTRDGLTDTQFEEIWGTIVRNSYVVAKERKISGKFWCPELNDYVTQELYVPDPEITIKQVKKNNNNEYEVIYNSATIKFIGY